MKAWGVAVYAFIAGVLPSLLIKLVKMLGLGAVTYVGINTLVQNIIGGIGQDLGGLPAIALAVVSIAKVDVAISMVGSAVVIKLVLTGVNALADRRRSIKWNTL